MEAILRARLALCAEHNLDLCDAEVERQLAWAQWARSLTTDRIVDQIRYIAALTLLDSPLHYALREAAARLKDTRPRPSAFDVEVEEHRRKNP